MCCVCVDRREVLAISLLMSVFIHVLMVKCVYRRRAHVNTSNTLPMFTSSSHDLHQVGFTSLCMYMCACVCVCVRAHASVHALVCVFVCAHPRLCACIGVCMC